MNIPERIFVIGHMGAGKSLFAEALAKSLGYEYVDANPSLERYIGRSLNEILGEAGEAAFHRCETDILQHCIQRKKIVVVLEEAVMVTEENRALLSSQCVIYLKVSIPEQLARMKKGGRVSVLPIVDMKAFLEKQHVQRDHLFEAVATLTIDSVSVEKDMDVVMKAFQAG